MKQEPWCLPVTLVNAKIGSIAEITYPCSNAEMIEALARCKIPYGSGAYYHKVEEDHMDGRRKDALTKALAGTIESKAAPPTMRELNFLAVQIQCMPERKRNVLQKTFLSFRLRVWRMFFVWCRTILRCVWMPICGTYQRVPSCGMKTTHIFRLQLGPHRQKNPK